jgi:exonuclease SbcD
MAVFDGVDYLALGHLHGQQQIGAGRWYSGSPLAYSFSEHRQVKGSLLVDLGPQGVRSVTPIPAPVPRSLALLRGHLDDLLDDPAHEDAEGAWCQITLTDPVRPRDAMTRVRARFPHTLVLSFDPEGSAADESDYRRRVQGRSELDVCCGFIEHVRGGAGPDEYERALLGQALEAARAAERDDAA